LDKRYKLDFNHSPDLFVCDRLESTRLRSGDDYSIELLGLLDSFFTSEFGFAKAGFFDFSPYSIALFLQKVTAHAPKIAASVKLPYFCIQALELLQTFGYEVVWVEAKKDGYLCEKSLASAKKSGAEMLFCSLVDEDTFLPENMETVYKYFEPNRLILDISNGVKKIETPKTLAAIFWGYKLGSFKHSGIYLCNDERIEFLDGIDLTVYAHLKEVYDAYKYDNGSDKKDNLYRLLKKALGDDFSTFVDTRITLPNSLYCRFAGILAREFIRSLALENIYVTNGELCSLGLSKPSKILQSLGYTVDEAREGISISFDADMTIGDIEYLAGKIAFKYKQLKAILKS